MFFDHYPYTNFHNVNLDWVLQAVKAWGRTVEANDRAFKDLKEANESFKAYVKNYLQDLDITDEINTKLDLMLAEGTLTPYFAPYVKGYVESWLAHNVTPTTPALDKTLSLDDAAANAAATGERIESAAYLRTLDGPKLSNLLNKNLIIPGYRIQSACKAGDYFYVCGGSEAADGKGFIAKMSSLDFKDAEITYYTDLGHANDITYSYSTNRLYVTTVGEGVEWGIWNINPNDLTDKTLITNCPENTIGIQYVGGWVFVLAPPRIYRTLDFETYTLVINNTNEILNKFSIQSDGRISQTLVRLPNDVVGWVGSYIKEPEHLWYGFIAYFGSHGAITFDVFPTYNAECQAAIWDEKSTVYVISNGTTSPAYTVLRMDCGDLKYLELGAGKDLNNYTGEGLFYLIGAATMDNCPVNNEGLTLKVSRQGLLNTRQDIYTNSGRHLYRIKLFNAGTWGEWVEQAAEIAQIKEDLSEYNVYEILHKVGTFNNGTSRGVTYTWNSDKTKCTVSGTAEGMSANSIYNAFALPPGIEAGRTYPVLFTTTNNNILLEIIVYLNGATSGGSSTFIRSNESVQEYSIPAECTGMTIRLRVSTGNVGDGTVEKIAMLSVDSNSILSAKIDSIDQTISKNEIVNSSENLVETTANNVFSLSNTPYGGNLIYSERTGENVGGVLRHDGTVIYPRAANGNLPSANAPRRFINSVMRSYVGNDALVYGNEHTLFSRDCTNEIDCSSFVAALMYGIFYNNSKYVTNNNVIRYNNGENMYYRDTEYTRLLSYQLAEYYAERKRFFAMPIEPYQAFNVLEYGDLLFTPNSGLESHRYYNIAHVMMVVGKIPDGRRVIVAQAGGGQEAYKVRDFYNTVAKISVFTISAESIENCFVAFARPNYSAMYSSHVPDEINGDDFQLGNFWRDGLHSYASTWSGTEHLVPVIKGSKVRINSKSDRNPILSIQEYTDQMVYIKSTNLPSSVPMDFQLSDTTSYITINYGFASSSGLSPTLSDLSMINIAINQ